MKNRLENAIVIVVGAMVVAVALSVMYSFGRHLMYYAIDDLIEEQIYQSIEKECDCVKEQPKG